MSSEAWVGQLEEPEAKATAAGLLLQEKYMTFPEYHTIEAKDKPAPSKPEPNPVLVPPQSLGRRKGASPRAPFASTGRRPPAAEGPISLRASPLMIKVGRSLEAEARTQGQAAPLQEQDQGVEKPEALATPLGNQDRRLHEFPSARLAQDQDLLGQNGAGMIGERGLDGGRSLRAKERTQEQAALQQDQDQGM